MSAAVNGFLVASVMVGSLFFIVAFIISFGWVMYFRKRFLKEYESFLEQLTEEDSEHLSDSKERVSDLGGSGSSMNKPVQKPTIKKKKIEAKMRKSTRKSMREGHEIYDDLFNVNDIEEVMLESIENKCIG